MSTSRPLPSGRLGRLVARIVPVAGCGGDQQSARCGYCVSTFKYGNLGTGDIAGSARELDTFGAASEKPNGDHPARPVPLGG